MLHVSVKGGTNAGRLIRHPKPEDWSCPVCLRDNRSHWVRCTICRTPRPR